MDLIWDGITEAFRLIFTGDGYVFDITLLSLLVSGGATLVALVIGLTVASVLAFRAPPGRTVALSVFNAGMALPPVAVGLLVAIMLWRSGPLGQLHLLYTPGAIVAAQAVIATPVITAISAAGLQGLAEEIIERAAPRRLRRSGLRTGRRNVVRGGALAGSGGIALGLVVLEGGNFWHSTNVFSIATELSGKTVRITAKTVSI